MGDIDYLRTAGVLQRVRAALGKRMSTSADAQEAARARSACVSIDSLVAVLASPAFLQLAHIQRGLRELNDVMQAGCPLSALDDFHFSPNDGIRIRKSKSSLEQHRSPCTFYTFYDYINLVNSAPPIWHCTGTRTDPEGRKWFNGKYWLPNRIRQHP